MKQKSIKILITISLAFNIAFIGVYVYHALFSRSHSMMRDHRQMPPPIFRDRFDCIMQDLRPDRVEFMEASHCFFKMITDPEIDDETLSFQLDEMISIQMEIEKKMGQGMIDIRKEMSPNELAEARRFFRYRKEKFKKSRFDRANKIEQNRREK